MKSEGHFIAATLCSKPFPVKHTEAVSVTVNAYWDLFQPKTGRRLCCGIQGPIDTSQQKSLGSCTVFLNEKEMFKMWFVVAEEGGQSCCHVPK